MHTLRSILELLVAISVPAFAIASMLSMGLRTPPALLPLPAARPPHGAVPAGGELRGVPAVGTLLIWLLNGLMPAHIAEGFVIALCAAGAPFVLQLGAMARIPYSETAGPMAVLLLGSIVFMPLVVPFLLQDVQVDAGAVAGLLLGTMLPPMIAGIVVAAVFPHLADVLARIAAVFPHLADVLARIAGGVAAISAVLMFVAGFGSNTVLLLDVLLSPALLVAAGLIALAFAAGRASGELAGHSLTVPDGPAILSSQRNIAAALLVARAAGDDNSQLVLAILLLSAVGFVMLVPYALATGVVRRKRAGERITPGVLLGIVGPKSD